MKVYNKSLKKINKASFLSIFFLIFLLSNYSDAAWEKVTVGENGQTFYIDKDQIEETENYVYFWELVDYSIPDEYGDLSARIFIQGDCQQFRFQWLYISYHKESMAADQSKVVKASELVAGWQNPCSHSTAKSVLEYVCNYVGLML